MVDIVNYLELSTKFSKITSDDSIIYKNKNHSIMISKEEADRIYLLYKKQVIVVFTVSSKNEQLILDRLEKTFTEPYIETVDSDKNIFTTVQILVNSNFIYDSTNYNIENLPILTKYTPIVIDKYLIFLDIKDKKVVYCIQLDETDIRKKERDVMPTKQYINISNKENNRLKKIFNKVVNMESDRFKISLELLKIGCRHDEGNMYIFMDKILILLNEKELLLTVLDTDITEVPFKINGQTIDEIIEYLENIYL